MAGHGGPYNFVSEGSPQRLVDDIMAYLWGMSDNADEMMSILKKGTCFTALYIRNWGFLDVCNYLLTAGFSYTK